MADIHRALKQWCLGKTETVNSLENWWENLMYTVSQDEVFTPFLVPDKTWLPRGRTCVTRAFTDDDSTVAEDKKLSAQQKVASLEVMLGQIAHYCPVISHNTIAKTSKSISHIYQTIRLHYGFQSSGSQFLDFADIRLELEERHEDLYQRILAFVEDNLLQKDSAIKHHDMLITDSNSCLLILHAKLLMPYRTFIVHDSAEKLCCSTNKYASSERGFPKNVKRASKLGTILRLLKYKASYLQRSYNPR